MDVVQLKIRFDAKLYELINKKGSNTQIFTKADYLEMIEKVKSAKYKTSGKTPDDYHRLRRYDVMTFGGLETLIVPVKENSDSIICYVHTEDIFHILHETHLSLRHGGRNRMVQELTSKYKNITREMIMTYLNVCETCSQKQKILKDVRKGFEKRSIIGKEMSSRCQVDIIDMQSQADDQYKFILVYQDYPTKYVLLKPLRTNRAKEVANVIIDFFSTFGAPNILHSDNNGQEFVDEILEELSKSWPELKMIHGKPNNSSEGPNYAADQDIVNLLSAWMESNKTNKWSHGLRFVQLRKNNTYHAAIQSTPYEAMFGVKMRFGIGSSLPKDVFDAINTEEELETVLNFYNDSKDINPSDFTGSFEKPIPSDLLSISIGNDYDSKPTDPLNQAGSIKEENVEMNPSVATHFSNMTPFTVKEETPDNIAMMSTLTTQAINVNAIQGIACTREQLEEQPIMKKMKCE